MTIPDDVSERIDYERRQRDVSAAAVIREAIEKYVVEPSDDNVPFFVNMIKSDGSVSTLGRDSENILEREYADRIEESSGLNERRQKNATWATRNDVAEVTSDSSDR